MFVSSAMVKTPEDYRGSKTYAESGIAGTVLFHPYGTGKRGSCLRQFHALLRKGLYLHDYKDHTHVKAKGLPIAEKPIRRMDSRLEHARIPLVYPSRAPAPISNLHQIELVVMGLDGTSSHKSRGKRSYMTMDCEYGLILMVVKTAHKRLLNQIVLIN